MKGRMAPKADSEMEGREEHGCDRIVLRCIVVASHGCTHRRGAARRGETRAAPRTAMRERIVTGINAFRPRDRDLLPMLDSTEFDFILYANRPFNEINAAREVN